MKKLTFDFVKETLIKKFPNYDFSLFSSYKNNATPIQFLCKKHGIVEECYNTLQRTDIPCRQCRKEYGIKIHNHSSYTYTTEEFIKAINDKFPKHKLDFSKFKYNTKGSIIVCKKHGNIKVSPYKIMSGAILECPTCHKEFKFLNMLETHIKTPISNLLFKYNKIQIMNLNEIYNDIEKLMYEKNFSYLYASRALNYKLCYCICEKHGEFNITFSQLCYHSARKSMFCPDCKFESQKRYYTQEEFINILKKIFYDKKYDYSQMNYVSYYGPKVKIICPIHGEFFREPIRLLDHRGCPKCHDSLLERELLLFFKEKNINFIYQYRNKDILGRKSLDFYLPDKKIAIECQGKQHFHLDSKFNSNLSDMSSVFENDINKFECCKQNGIKVLYYSKYKKDDYFQPIFTNKEKLLDYILKYE